MSRRQKEPLRALTQEERTQLEQLSRSRSEPASHVARAKALLAVANGSSFVEAARASGRRSGDAVSKLVAGFNKDGLPAIIPGHGGGPRALYGVAERERILSEARRPPDREQDGTATWSIATLQQALRNKGLPQVSGYTIWLVLREAGLSWQKDRTWCETGVVQRRRKSGLLRVTDPDAEAKKS
jgi:transposase